MRGGASAWRETPLLMHGRRQHGESRAASVQHPGCTPLCPLTHTNQIGITCATMAPSLTPHRRNGIAARAPRRSSKTSSTGRPIRCR
eukprot:1143150-Prymnesium_polylepis.1